MLLTNMSKDDSVATRILDLKREKPKEEWKVSDSEMAMDQLMDLFVKGEGKTLNKEANFDYLAYFFADVARVGKRSICLYFIRIVSLHITMIFFSFSHPG